MRIKPSVENSNIEVSSEVYQAKDGGFRLNWGKGIILLKKQEAEIIAWDMPNFDQSKYNEFYERT